MNKNIFTAAIIFLVLFSSYEVNSCATNGRFKTSTKKINQLFKKKSRRISSTEIVPFARSHPKPRWESRLGNVLLEYQPLKNGKVTISIPTRIKQSSFSPFGDGQTNAKMDLDAKWTRSTGFPVIGVESIENGKIMRTYKFDPTLNISGYTEKMLSDGWYEVRPDNWQTVFYFNFQANVLSINEFLKGIPKNHRIFPKDRVAPNIAKISKEHAFENLQNQDLGPGYNKEAWFSDNVHGLFPNENGERTAIGSVLTWGIKTKQNEIGSFKNLYTCFQARDINLESNKNLPFGVPSGAGWHLVGDAAESVLNNLSLNAIPFAIGRTHGKANSAYEMEESITAVWLQSDEVQVTRKGEFHWYLNPYEENVCTEIWVHNCVPDLMNNWGFNCK